MVRYRVVRKDRKGKAYPKAWKYYEHIMDISRSLTATCQTYGVGQGPYDVCGIDIETYTLLHEDNEVRWIPLAFSLAQALLSKQAAFFVDKVHFEGCYNKQWD